VSVRMLPPCKCNLSKTTLGMPCVEWGLQVSNERDWPTECAEAPSLELLDQPEACHAWDGSVVE
jgi:hypothetical protein